jgi:hypothetical protein
MRKKKENFDCYKFDKYKKEKEMEIFVFVIIAAHPKKTRN